jgi:hypothetical protein
VIIIYCDIIHCEVKHTHEQNENIHLWLLEQERLNDQKRVQLQTECKEKEQSSIVSALDFEDSSIPVVENNPPELHTLTDFEQLTKEKTILEEKSRCLDEKQRTLDFRARMLCAELITEIRKRNSEKLQKVAQLREKVETLENQVSFVNKIPELKRENAVKRQEITQLQDLIGSLEIQFQELSTSDAHEENTQTNVPQIGIQVVEQSHGYCK